MKIEAFGFKLNFEKTTDKEQDKPTKQTQSQRPYRGECEHDFEHIKNGVLMCRKCKDLLATGTAGF